METYIVDQSDLVRTALWWFVPYLLWGALGAFLGGTLWFLTSCLKDFLSSSKPNKLTKEIVILGLKGAGKTTLWSRLRGKTTVSENTGVEEIPSFELYRDDKSVIIINETKDIGGGDEHVGRYYEQLLKNGCFIYFLINAKTIDIDKKIIASRLVKLFEVISKKELRNVGFKIIATHIDEVEIGKVTEHSIFKILEFDELEAKLRKKFDKVKGVDLEKNIVVGNLCDDAFIQQIIDEIKHSSSNDK